MATYPDRHPLTSARAIDAERILSGAYWAELRTFLGVAKAKSINRACQTLGLSKSTVSRQLQRLQDLHGGALLLTSQRGIRLTEAGQRLASMLVHFDHALSTVADEVKDDADQIAGTVRISITDALGILFVIPALPELIGRSSRLRVQIKTPRNMSSLRENQTDIMLSFAAQSAADLTVKRLGTVHMVPMAARTYVEARGMPTRDTIQHHDFVTSERFSAQDGPWQKWNGLVRQGRTVHEGDASLTFGLMVKAGLGIGLLTSFNVLEPAFVPVDLRVRVRLPIYLVALTERLSFKPVAAVWALLSDIFGPRNPWFGPELRLDGRDTLADAGYHLLFNVPISESEFI